MSDLVEFLRARLGEDEEVARAAVAASDRLWALDNDQLGRPWVYDSDNGSPLMEAIMGEGDREVLTHVVAHHPDRVLREVKAKRRIVDEIVQRDDYSPTGYGMERLPGVTLAVMAAVYADHPDYRAGEWD